MLSTIGRSDEAVAPITDRESAAITYRIHFSGKQPAAGERPTMMSPSTTTREETATTLQAKNTMAMAMKSIIDRIDHQ
jgi:hypothetical protein